MWAQVPTAEREQTTIAVLVRQITRMVLSLGDYDMSSGADRVEIVYTLQAAACRGMNGQCKATFVERRRLQTASGTATVDMERTYDHATSANASTPITDLVDGALAGRGAAVSSAQTTSLSATTTVTALGTTESSLVDEALTSNGAIATQINSVWLPSGSGGGNSVSVSDGSVDAPPSPPPRPPPPPPSPSPRPPAAINASGAGGDGGDGGSSTLERVSAYLFGVATALAALACFIVGFMLARRRRQRALTKLRVVPHQAAPPLAAAAGGSRTRVAVDGTSQPPGRYGVADHDAAAAPRQPAARHDSSDDDDDHIEYGVRSPAGAASSGGLLASVLGGAEVACATPGFDTSTARAALPVRSASGRLQLSEPAIPLRHQHGSGRLPLVDDAAPSPTRAAPQLHKSASHAALQGRARPLSSLTASASLAVCAKQSRSSPRDEAPPTPPPVPAAPARPVLPGMIGGVAVAQPSAAEPEPEPEPEPPPPTHAPPIMAGLPKRRLKSGEPPPPTEEPPPPPPPASLAKTPSMAGLPSRRAPALPDGKVMRSSWDGSDADRARAMARSRWTSARAVVNTGGLKKADSSPPRRPGSAAASIRLTPPPPLLRKMTSSTLAREPEDSPHEGGFDGGGGVRLYPPHLEDTLNFYSDSLVIEKDARGSERRQSTEMGAGASARSRSPSVVSPPRRFDDDDDRADARSYSAHGY